MVTDVDQACDWLVVLANGRLALHTSIASAKRDFQTVPVGELEGQAAVGTFPGPGGELLVLVRGSSGGRPASLEEIVLGHLAAKDSNRAEEAA